MTDDPGPGFRAELETALGVVEPQLEGLNTLAQAGLSPAASTIIQEATEARRRRRSLIIDVIAGLNAVLEKVKALTDDGYPDLPALTVPWSTAEELQKEQDAVEAAIAIFKAELLAAKVQLNLTVANREDT